MSGPFSGPPSLSQEKAHSHARRSEISIAIEIQRYFALVQTGGYISLSPSGIILLTELAHAWYQAGIYPLPLPGKKYQDYLLESSRIRRDASNRANSQIIARFLAIYSAMLIAIISEIFMSTLVTISRFRSRCKNRDLYPANSRKCECP